MGNYEWTVQHKGEFSGWSDESTAAAFTAVAPPDCLYSGSGDSTVRKLDPNDLTEASQFGGHSGNVSALAWGADGYLYSVAMTTPSASSTPTTWPRRRSLVGIAAMSAP